MGTSVNQPSPNTVPWKMVAATYLDDTLPLERVLQELWRAVLTEPEVDIHNSLSSSGVVVCLTAAVEASTPVDAVERAYRGLAEEKANSIVADLARRAVVLSFREGDRLESFTANLFAQVTDYLVSRDLPGFIGPAFRNKSVSDAIRFKDELRKRTWEIVKAFGSAPDAKKSSHWRDYVRAVVARLAGV